MRMYLKERISTDQLDIFIVEADVGIEYQGVQHYKAVGVWSSKEGLEERCRGQRVELRYQSRAM